MYRCHQEAFSPKKTETADKVHLLLSTIESACVNELLWKLRVEPDKLLVDSESLFKDAVEAEISIYQRGKNEKIRNKICLGAGEQ